MTITRRTFIESALAAVAAPRGLSAAEEPILKFGLMSDTHLSLTGSTATLLKQFEYMSQAGVKAVLVTGDVVDLGLLSELRRFRTVWDEAFPNGKNAQGENCRLFVCWGNHDYHDQTWFADNGYGAKEWSEAILNGNQNEAWNILMDEDFPGELSVLKLDGVTFVTAHWGHFGDGLAPFLFAHAAEIPTDRPVFFLQHSHPYMTCYGNWYAKTNSGANATTLAAHPNFFVMSGHSHISNVANDALWMGKFVSMGAGRNSGSSGRNFYSWVKGLREYNTSSQSEMYGLKHMADVDWGRCDMASIITVYPSRVVVERREYSHDRDLEPWDIPFPFQNNADNPYPFIAQAKPPQFPADAVRRIRLSYRHSNLYPLKAANGAKAGQVRLEFPVATGDGPHSQVVDYLVSVRRKGADGAILDRLVAQPYAYGTDAERAQAGAWVVFGRDELPQGEDLVATITPLDAIGCFNGRGGDPISFEFRLPRPVISYFVL